MQMARERLDKEINIIDMIKDWRYFKLAISHIIKDERKRLSLKERSRYYTIKPDNGIEQELEKSNEVQRAQSVRR